MRGKLVISDVIIRGPLQLYCKMLNWQLSVSDTNADHSNTHFQKQWPLKCCSRRATWKCSTGVLRRGPLFLCYWSKKEHVSFSVECSCVHGVCDNRPGSGGVCRRGSCLEGYSGDNCDKMATPCNSDGLHVHCHIHAYCVYVELNTK